MKYSENNPPLVCMQTQSSCYKGTGKMQIKGVLWHDTGANNPNLKRYVQPSDNAPDRAEWLERLGKNPYNNDWNHAVRKAGMNCWIGKLADGTVTTVQTMPWNYRPWGCGSGKKGSCNNGWIQFEICEDNKNDADYFGKIYEEACEITAYLCKLYHIDPLGTADCGGVTVPTILCHQDSYKLGLGSNHSDIYDWFKRYGKDMKTVREDVDKLLKADGGQSTNDQAKRIMTDTDMDVWDTLITEIQNPFGVAGLMGNLKAESGLKAANLQNAYEKSLGMSDEEYTAAVDKGAYDNFTHDGAGYGLAQWTYWSRKKALLKAAKEKGTSIGDLHMQLGFLLKEIKGYTKVWNTLRNASSVREASDAVLLGYERPANQDISVQEERAAYGMEFFERFASEPGGTGETTSVENLPPTKYYRVRKTWEDKASQIGAFTILQNAINLVNLNPGYAAFDDQGNQVYPSLLYKVRITNKALNYRRGPAKSYQSYGYIKPGTYKIVEEKDGWGRIEEPEAWIMLEYTVKL